MAPLLGIRIAKKPDSARTSAELVRDFVFYTADLEAAAAAEIAGVSTATLTRWRMMGARQLRADVRRRLLRYVKGRERSGTLTQAA